MRLSQRRVNCVEDNLRMMATIGAAEAENGESGKAPICIWCDVVLDSETTHGRVCSRCYRLLKLAGITEDEIFGRDRWADEDNSKEG